MKTCIISLLLVALSHMAVAQNLRFSYTVTNNANNTSTIEVFVANSGSGTEPMAGFTMNLYYNSAESRVATINPVDTSPLASQGWFVFPSNTDFISRSNSSIPIVHNGLGEFNVSDAFGNGSSFGTTPVKIMTINMDDTPGTTTTASDFYLAGTAEGHPAQVYNDNTKPIPTSYPVIVLQSSSSLPVEWLGFAATPQNGQVLCQWETATEINSAFFLVEKSQDGELYSAFAKVDAAGNSDELQSYDAWDNEPFMGLSYYRIKQVDTDGTHSYSNMVSVMFTSEGSLMVFPNPASDRVFLDYESPRSGPVEINLLDINGRHVLTQNLELNAGRNRIPMDIGHVSEGVYIIQLNQWDQVYNLRLVVK